MKKIGFIGALMLSVSGIAIAKAPPPGYYVVSYSYAEEVCVGMGGSELVKDADNEEMVCDAPGAEGAIACPYNMDNECYLRDSDPSE